MVIKKLNLAPSNDGATSTSFPPLLHTLSWMPLSGQLPRVVRGPNTTCDLWWELARAAISSTWTVVISPGTWRLDYGRRGSSTICHLHPFAFVIPVIPIVVSLSITPCISAFFTRRWWLSVEHNVKCEFCDTSVLFTEVRGMDGRAQRDQYMVTERAWSTPPVASGQCVGKRDPNHSNDHFFCFSVQHLLLDLCWSLHW